MEHHETLKSVNIEELAKLLNSVTIELTKYEELVSIEEPHYLKRYNPLYISVENTSDTTIELLLLTVVRNNSKIGSDNRCTIPLKTFGLKPNSKAKYRLLAFDPFREIFDGIEIRLTTLEDWATRSVVDKWIGRAPEFSKKLKWYNFIDK